MSLSAEARVAIETFRSAAAGTEAAFRSLRSDLAGAIERLDNVVESLIGRLKSSDALLVPLLTGATAPARSAHAAVHVTILSLRIGLELRDSHLELTRLGQVAMLRDVGGSGRSPAGAGLDERGAAGRRGARAQEIVEIVDAIRARRGLPPAGPKLIDLRERPFLYVQEFLGYEDPEPGPAESSW